MSTFSSYIIFGARIDWPVCHSVSRDLCHCGWCRHVGVLPYQQGSLSVLAEKKKKKGSLLGLGVQNCKIFSLLLVVLMGKFVINYCDYFCRLSEYILPIYLVLENTFPTNIPYS